MMSQDIKLPNITAYHEIFALYFLSNFLLFYCIVPLFHFFSDFFSYDFYKFSFHIFDMSQRSLLAPPLCFYTIISFCLLSLHLFPHSIYCKSSHISSIYLFRSIFSHHNAFEFISILSSFIFIIIFMSSLFHGIFIFSRIDRWMVLPIRICRCA